MGGMRLIIYLQYVYGPLKGCMAYIAYYFAIVVELTNYDFLCLVWKIAIGLLSISALAALKV